MTGVWVAVATIAVALVFGAYRKLHDGRARVVDDHSTMPAAVLGAELGAQATFVQFSASVCAPCRATHRVLSDVVAEDPRLAHIEINAETRLDLVEKYAITRTPTVLLLDSDGTVRHRIVGATARPEVLRTLNELAARPAA